MQITLDKTTIQTTAIDTRLRDAAHTEYLALFDSLDDAIEFEAACLSAGESFLPPFAVAVLADSDAATAEYYGWLQEQLDETKISDEMVARLQQEAGAHDDTESMETYLAVYDGPGGPISAIFEAPTFVGWPVVNPVVEHIAMRGRDWYDASADCLNLDPSSPTIEADLEAALLAGRWMLLHKAEDTGRYAVYSR